MRRVQDAMSEAEASMQRLHSLPSARLPSAWDRALGALRPVAQFAALAAACAAIHSLGAAARALGSLAVGLGVAWYGLRRSSLSPSGAAAVSWGAAAARVVLQPAWCCWQSACGTSAQARLFTQHVAVLSRQPASRMPVPVAVAELWPSAAVVPQGPATSAACAGGGAGRRHAVGELSVRPAAAHLLLHVQQDHAGRRPCPRCLPCSPPAAPSYRPAAAAGCCCGVPPHLPLG